MEQIVIGSPRVQIMEAPTRDSGLVDEIFYGMEIQIKKELYNDWLWIRTYYGYEGYVRRGDVEFVEHNYERKEFVISAFADVFAEPDIHAKRYFTLMRGAIVTVLIRESNGYSEIRLADGRKAYIKTSQLSPVTVDWRRRDENTLRRDIIHNAKRYLGVQYRYGGKSPDGIDCSGLCFMAYLLSGVIIFRDSQRKEGFPVKSISKKMLKPADLLYFDGHVALYLGESKFMHATNQIGADGVVIQSLNPEDDGYRKDLAARIIDIGSIIDLKQENLYNFNSI